MIGELLGAGISAAANFGLSQLNYENQKKLAAQQNQYNIDMWRMNNEYNTPSAQMQRFQDAGLNPNLIYGQGSAGNSGSAPQQVVPNAPDYSHAMSDISKFGQLLDIANRVETLKSQRLDNKIKEDRHDNMQQDWILKNLRNTWEQEKQLAIRGNWRTNPDGQKSNGAYNYFVKLYDLSLKRLMENNLNLSAKSALYRTQQTLNNLQSNFYRVRNAWQPWQYGVDMGVDALGGLLGVRKLFQKSPQKIFNVTNNRYSVFHDYHSKY